MQARGKADAEIAAALTGNVQMPLSAFKGKRAYMYVKAAPDELDAQGRQKLADKNFVTKPQYEQAKRVIATLGAPKAPVKTANGTAGAQTAGTPTPPAAPGATAGGPTPPPPGTTPGIGDLFG